MERLFGRHQTGRRGAKETCPVFTGKVGKRLHIGFDDPDAFIGTDDAVILEFRRVRDEILKKIKTIS